MTPHWTIGICTWNRCELLQRTLNSVYQLQGLQEQPGDVEVLVVNNGSTDDTASLLHQYQDRPGFRHVLETKLGHTFARNRLVNEAAGQIILWTDGDVQLDPLWLSAYREQVQRQPECDFWGGPIHPVFLKPRPLWLARNYELLAGCFAQKDLGPKEIPLSPSQLPYGANFAVRTSTALQFPFDVELGRRGSGCVGEDERDFLLRLLKEGHQGHWVPNAKVNHLIPADRMTLHYIGRYFAGQATVQWRQGEAPAWSAEKFRAAARDHLVWYRLTRWSRPSRIWLEHWIKAAQFQQWAELAG